MSELYLELLLNTYTVIKEEISFEVKNFLQLI